MGMLKLDIPHTLNVEDARTRVAALLEHWSKKHGVKITWAGDKATFDGKVMGISFNGNLTVLAQKIAGEASDPGFLFRGQAQKYLTQKFGDALDPKKSVSDVQKDA